MTDQEFEARRTDIFDKTYLRLSFELQGPEFDDETRNAILKREAAAEYIREIENNPEFKEAAIRCWAKETVEVWREDKSPKGEYDPEAHIRLSDGDTLVRMNYLTRAHMLDWQKRETDPANLAYIESRLNLWKPEYATLAELEGDHPSV